MGSAFLIFLPAGMVYFFWRQAAAFSHCISHGLHMVALVERDTDTHIHTTPRPHGWAELHLAI